MRWIAFALLITAASAVSAQDLTGLWVDDTGGGALYRVRQVGSRVVWSVDGVPQRSYVNVFSGEIQGQTITGTWTDLPGSPSLGGGTLVLRIESNDRLVKTGENPCCYAGRVWIRKGSSMSSAACTPVGTWNWVDGHTVEIRSNGTAEGPNNEGRWEHIGSNQYRVTWPNGGWIDTLALSADGRVWEGTNQFGRQLRMTCKSGPATPPPAAPRAACNPVGTWQWMDGIDVTLRADGTAIAPTNEGRWESLGGNRYRISWRNGGWIDTLTLSPDGRVMEGTNNVGRVIQVTCK